MIIKCRKALGLIVAFALSTGFYVNAQTISHFDISYASVQASGTLLGGGTQIWQPQNSDQKLTDGFLQPNKKNVQVLPSLAGKKNKARFYPNPVSDKLFFSFEYEYKFERVLCISDLSGRIHKRLSLHSASGTIDLSELQNGIYFLKINKNGSDFYRIFKISVVR
jgi:hypothetical protein